jgi:hypothetical protein
MAGRNLEGNMTDEENYILEYLKTARNYFVSEREITRRAAGRHHAEASPDWAKPLLRQMTRRDILEMDPAGHFRVKPREVQANGRKWISPHFANILRNSQKDFSSAVTIEIAEDADMVAG